MKIATLQAFFARQRSAKLHVTTDTFALTGIATPTRDHDENLLVVFSPHVVWWFADQRVQEAADPMVLRLRDDMQTTRRMQTHLRHLRERKVPSGYAARARDL